MNTFVSALALTFLVTGLPAASAAEPLPKRSPSPAFVEREVLVKIDESSSPGLARRVHDDLGAQRLRRLPVRGWELVRLPHGMTVPEGVAAYKARPEVAFAEPNYVFRSAGLPNDPSFGELWGLHNVGQTVAGRSGSADADIDAPEAWDISRGDASVLVAVVDSGVDYQHPELSGRMWTNPGETGSGKETDLLDNDLNGYVNDWRGWDWVSDDNDPQDPIGHGSHVAGIIGAAGNNAAGIAGTNWDVRIMPLRAIGSEGGTAADVASAFRYAAAKGARVVNASFGGPNSSFAITDAIRAASNTLFVVSAGNGNDDGIGDNNDATPDYPCALNEPNLVCVTATDHNDELAGFSNYGPNSVDLAAPGTNVLSTIPGGFLYASGTSMSAPYVSGVAALGWASTPQAGQGTIKNALLDGADKLSSLSGKVATGGRLNAFNTVSLLTTGAMPRPASTPTSTPTPTPTPAISPSTEPTPTPSTSDSPSPSPSAQETPSPGSSPSSSPPSTPAPSPEPSSSHNQEPQPTPTPQPTAPPDPSDSRKGTTSISLDLQKTRATLHFSGSVSPAHPDHVVTVTLLRRTAHGFVRLARRVRTLGDPWDSDLDGTSESLYQGQFRRARPGNCQLRVRFAGDHDHGPTGTRRFFRC